MRNRIRHFLTDSRAITSVEYALLLAFIGATVAAALVLLALAVVGVMDTTTASMTG